MAFVNSSMIGVDYNNASSTALFALGTSSLGSGGSRWVYVVATGTLTTGMCVAVFPSGTAYALTTALLNGGDTVGTTGNLDLAFVQTVIPQGQFGWAARDGIGLYVATKVTAIFYALSQGAHWRDVLPAHWNADDFGMLNMILTFWFVGRSIEKYQK